MYVIKVSWVIRFDSRTTSDIQLVNGGYQFPANFGSMINQINSAPQYLLARMAQVYLYKDCLSS